MKKLLFLSFVLVAQNSILCDQGYSEANFNTTPVADVSAKVEFQDNYLYLKASSSWPCHEILLYPRLSLGGMNTNLRDLAVQVVFVDPASGANKVLYFTKFKDKPVSKEPPVFRIVFNSAGGTNNPAHYRIYVIKPVIYGSNIYYGPGGRPANLLRRDQLYNANDVLGISWLKQGAPCDIDNYAGDEDTLILNEKPATRTLHKLQGLRSYE